MWGVEGFLFYGMLCGVCFFLMLFYVVEGKGVEGKEEMVGIVRGCCVL